MIPEITSEVDEEMTNDGWSPPMTVTRKLPDETHKPVSLPTHCFDIITLFPATHIASLSLFHSLGHSLFAIPNERSKFNKP